ncbi:uncharacterized protein LOC127248505 [Andrographis paniculata]|uniref:uncharacterized protein LOC127248505 n=1 Tax=Andrographis paniculata TaxID=175694 RepID=UPI0021E75231|nr:uncharacterized protein LOC127248505 [Andrographis paniculata]
MTWFFMDFNELSGYFLNHSPLVGDDNFYIRKENSNIVDLGLRLKVFLGIQSKRRWTYTKVNMNRMLIGRKICIYYYKDYLSLADRLEDMVCNLMRPQ